MRKETKNQRKKIPNFIVLSLICILVITILLGLVEWYRGTFDIASFLFNIIFSVFCSILASFIYAMIQKDYSEEMQSKLEEIDAQLKRDKELYDSGIISVRKKVYYDQENDFWKEILRGTDDRLDLVGHSINTWFSEDYKDAFCSKIKNMTKSGSSIQIIVGTESGEIDWGRIIHKGEDEFSDLNKTERTCYELYNLAKEIGKKERKNLKLHVVKLEVITYLYIRTDKRCFISPYILSPTNSKNSFLLELNSAIEYSKSFDADVKEMINNSKHQKWEDIIK